MKTKLFALFLLTTTSLAIAMSPATTHTPTPDPQPVPVTQADKIEVVFVLDTTASMGGLIETAKEKIWSIASSMASAQSQPNIEVGLVAFRDRGDDYVTRVTDLTSDLDSVYATLMSYSANGGGDGPESVNAALKSAIDDISWGTAPAYRVVFLVGDAPAHMEYNEERFPSIMRRAASRDIIVNSIRCGEDPNTAIQWQQIADLAHGTFFSVDQSAQAVAIATPFDAEIAKLSEKLDDTRVVFGNGEVMEKARSKTAATREVHAKATVASRARRAAFNATKAGDKNLYGDDDLVVAVTEGKVSVAELDDAVLPAPLQRMTVSEREVFVEDAKKVRGELNAQIDALVQQRAHYLTERVEALPDAEASLEYRLFDTVKSQAAEVGLSYDEAAAPKL